MQVVIPMSGFGERFRAAGYAVPKPLIEVEGKTMVEHVVDLFPGAGTMIFVCNEDHLAEPSFRMREIIERACPHGRIVGIPPHKLGPVHAVLAVAHLLDPAEPTIVNYCDFTCWWSFEDFQSFVRETDCAGAIPAYRGFHPHSLRGGVYAFLRESGLWAQDIQEKQPFTDTPMHEYASSGTYYFRSTELMTALMVECVGRGLDVRGEFYVSMVYKMMFERELPVAIYELEHFMQWGTPDDLRDYRAVSNTFACLATSAVPPTQRGAVMVPAVGAGKRFADEGYALPKLLIPVSGRPMIVQAASDLPRAERTVVVLRRDLPGTEDIERELATMSPSPTVHWLDGITDGQARSCASATQAVDAEAPLTIGSCDNGLHYDAAAFRRALESGEADLLVWGFRGHPDAARRPAMFGWLDVDAEGAVRGVSVKVPLAHGDPLTDPIVVGAFTFARAGDFDRCFARLVARNGRVNGELYVDSMVEDALALGLRVRLFEVDAYPGWGTPDDLRVFEYWQSCFHKWPAHPYRLASDRHVQPSARAALEARFHAFRAPRPAARRVPGATL
jgi:NDP-sugar pyrophosphorylase family protein